ncbi:MAG: ferrochelatase [Alphaproteobacteria bacterium]
MPVEHPTVEFGQVGVLIVNLGSPAGTDYWSMRRYLKQFLSDRRVIEVWRPLWLFILNAIVLSKRPQRSGRAYDEIWNRERDEGPLVTFTRAQAEKLRESLQSTGVHVDWAMRYGAPSIDERLRAMKDAGCERILVAALYPQYAAATTATVHDEVFTTLQAMRWQPAIRTLPPYYDHPAYIEALKQSLQVALDGLDFDAEHVLASFHGLPRAYLDKGDPYHCQCQKTTRLMREALGWDEEKLQIAFQSRVGRAEWLRPYTDETIATLARQGVRRLAVITPGFVSDCLETLEEIAMRGAETFRENGGESFHAVPCLNDSAAGMDVLETVIRAELAGWVD